jgi:hypothetical protein
MYTGDEMGFMIRWDISKLLEKIDSLKPSEVPKQRGEEVPRMSKKATFMTGFNEEVNKMQFLEEDI